MLTDLAYLAVLAGASPFLAWRAARRGKYRRGWGEKLLGRLPVVAHDPSRPVVWVHAVSVGEVLLLPGLIDRLKASRPELRFVVTTGTATGRNVAAETFPDDVVAFAPLDFSWSVREAVRRIGPSLFLLSELEIWPQWVAELTRAGVPIGVVNGRLGEKSFAGYRRLGPLLRPTFGRLAFVAAQTEAYAERFRALGCENVATTGSMKFDRAVGGGDVEAEAALAEVFGLRSLAATDRERGPRSLSVAAKEPVWVAGSTSAPEERVVLGAYRELRSRFPELRLVLVPRHKERFDEVARLIAAEGFALRRRSDGCESDAPGDAVRLLDTLGELSACWGLADVAFVGGSLPGTGRGGQNMIEPAAHGLPVLVGPDVRNFKAVVAMLREADAIETVTAETLAAAVGRLLTDRDGAEAMGRRAAGVVRSGLGATERTATLVEGYLQAAASSRAA